jgi:endonuclease/exonuclease/phosphatase (EEP) superfamily protein YafD
MRRDRLISAASSMTEHPPMTGTKAAAPSRLRRLGWGAVYALAMALTLATVASVFGQLWWVFDVANEFRLQWIMAGLVLIAGAVLIRRPRLALVGALSAALHAASIAGPLLVPGAEAAAGGGAAFRLTTLNLFYTNQDAQPTLDYVARMRPDVAVFQEAIRHWPASLAPLREAMPYVVEIPPQISFRKGVMLFSRHPIVDVAYVRPVPDYLPIVVARIAIGGDVVTVIAVHPPHPTSARFARIRALQMKAIAEIAARTEGPLVVAGDFNSTPWSRPFHDLTTQGRLVDAAARRPWQTTWPTWLPGLGLPIDHVLVNRHLVARRLERGPDIGSDHYPLTADLMMARPRAGALAAATTDRPEIDADLFRFRLADGLAGQAADVFGRLFARGSRLAVPALQAYAKLTHAAALLDLAYQTAQNRDGQIDLRLAAGGGRLDPAQRVARKHRASRIGQFEETFPAIGLVLGTLNITFLFQGLKGLRRGALGGRQELRETGRGSRIAVGATQEAQGHPLGRIEPLRVLQTVNGTGQSVHQRGGLAKGPKVGLRH